mgnify:CR=1 FL=1
MNPAEFLREGFVEIREHLGRAMLQTLGVILGVASVVATLGMTASMDARRDQYFRESGGTLLVGVYNQPPAELELTARQRAKMGLKLEDAAAIRETVDGFDLVVAEINRQHAVRAGATEENFRVTAIEPDSPAATAGLPPSSLPICSAYLATLVACPMRLKSCLK